MPGRIAAGRGMEPLRRVGEVFEFGGFFLEASGQSMTGAGIEDGDVLLFAYDYVPDGVDMTIPYITPANAPDHSGLPRAHIVTNGFDPLRDVDFEYAHILADAGCEVNYVHHEDLTHGFIQFTEHSDRAMKATREIGHAIEAALDA